MLALGSFLAAYSPRPAQSLLRTQSFLRTASGPPALPAQPSEYNLNLGKLVDSLGGDHPMLFERPQDLSLFVDTVELHDPSGRRLCGMGQYMAVFDLLRFMRRVAMEDAQLTHRIAIEHRQVRLRWSAKLFIKDLGLATLGGDPAVVHVDGVSAYELDGRGHVNVHRLENVVISGRDREALLDMPNLELMWRLPALVPPVAPPVPAAAARVALSGRAQAAAAATLRRVAARRTVAPHMLAAERADETPVERAAREREEMATEAERLKAVRASPEEAPAANGRLLGLFRAPDTCETNFDCEQPQVCCDLLIARVCCSSGMMVGMPQPSVQGSLIPIPVEKDDGRIPGALGTPSRRPGQAPW